MSNDTEEDKALKSFLQELAGGKSSSSVSLSDLRLLASSLAPTCPHSTQSLALLAVAKMVASVEQESKGNEGESARSIQSAFQPLIDEVLASEDAVEYTPSTFLLAALASLAPAGVVLLLTREIVSSEQATVDLLSVLLELAELPSSLQKAFADLLCQLAGSPKGRVLIRDRALNWVSSAVEYGQEDVTVACAVALSKLGGEEPQEGEGAEARIEREETNEASERDLARKLAAHVISTSPSESLSFSSSILATLEGLSVLSTRPGIRDLLADDTPFLSALLALSPVPQYTGGSLPVTPGADMVELDETALRPVNTTLCYGVATILVHLTMRRPVLSDQEQQAAQLRRLALSGKGKGAPLEDDPRESDDAVRARIKALIAAGVIPSLRGLGLADSVRVKEAVARISLNIVEEKAFLRLFVRDGGFKVLTSILRSIPDFDIACQALAKAVISVPPELLFPAPFKTNAIDALAPLYKLLLPSASLLQHFESLMALTNLASIDEDFPVRIFNAKLPDGKSSIMSVVENLLLDDNELVRRAAVELVCNLTCSEIGFKYFAGEDISGTEGGVSSPARAAGRLTLLLMLADVEDLPTRLAAGGALATVTDSQNACRLILSAKRSMSTTSTRNAWNRMTDMFEDDNPAVLFRALCIVSNIVNYAAAADKDQIKLALAAGLDGKLRNLDPSLDTELQEMAQHALLTLQTP